MMSFKYTSASVLLLIILIASAACAGGGDNVTSQTTTPSITTSVSKTTNGLNQQNLEEGATALLSLWRQDCDCTVGQILSYDNNADGTDDAWTIDFGRDEIEDDLYVRDNMDFEMTDSGLLGEITVSLENESDSDYMGYEYIIEIPKSFAETVDDIEFSVQPDEVINPDFIGKFLVDVFSDPSKAGEAVQELKFKAAIKLVEMDPGIAIDKVRLDYAKIKCKRLKSGTARIYCMFALAAEWNSPDVCDSIDYWVQVPGRPNITKEEIDKARRDCKEYVSSQNKKPKPTSTPTPKPTPTQAIPIELTIRVPEGSLIAGEEFTLKVDTTKGMLPEDPYYEWNFGDTSGIGIPFSSEVTHTYKEEGRYQVVVHLYDEEGGNLLASKTIEVDVNPPSVDFLNLINQTNYVAIWLTAPITTKSGSNDAFPYQWGAEKSLGRLKWDGTSFEMDWAESRHSERITGTIRQEGSELYVSLKARHEFAAGGETQFYEIEISELPLWTERAIKYGELLFDRQVQDSDVRQYVTYLNSENLVSVNWAGDLSLNVRFWKKPT